MSKHVNSNMRVPIESDNLCIKRDDSKCILCGACKSVCKYSEGVYGYYKLEETNDKAICIGCGQCTTVCPMNAIEEVKDYEKVDQIIKAKDRIVIFQTSPSVRVSFGELFGMEPGSFVEGKMVSALRRLGANYVLDTTFGADLTIMEEANELVSRIQNKQVLPQLTSCCPAWVKFVEIFFPEMIPNLSSVKSPILMQGAMIKTYFAEKMNLDPTQIINVAVTPCTAKKAEIRREEFQDSGLYHEKEMRDMDYVITTRELGEWMKKEGIDFDSLEDSTYDSVLGKGSGAGVIFGNSGGVMEAAVRTAHYILTGENNTSLLNFESVRGITGVKEAVVEVAGIPLKLVIINGTFQARKFLKTMKEQNLHYDFIEVMACSGGCIAGGGQPKTEVPLPDEIRLNRIQGLYHDDERLSVRYSHENPEIQAVYNEFLGIPLAERSLSLLHTTYHDQSRILKESFKTEV